MNNLKKYFLTFIVFAICGWLFEEFLFIVEDHVLVNRGSLWGPWLPIYGFGGFAVILLFYRYKDKKIMIGNVNIRPLVLFIETTIICVLVELISTYIIDFRSLWDYSDKFMNFEGRIALVPGLRFGILALLGIISLSITVNLVELACSAGLPVMYIEILNMNNLTNLEYYLYIILYVIFFMLDDIIVFSIAMISLELTGFSTKYGKLSKLIGGILLITIGILMLIKPEWLMFNFN